MRLFLLGATRAAHDVDGPRHNIYRVILVGKFGCLGQTVAIRAKLNRFTWARPLEYVSRAA
jgi:hypothetical protein